uniref:Uncharacterized protein n=1 Tax=Cyanothece sp. (strain PCC 7425 / ATCC 29141) TaxID=395961 RepID=B8HYV4_CYAP4
METLDAAGQRRFYNLCPYLLGKSIEWKHPLTELLGAEPTPGPYLLGKSIEWKHRSLRLIFYDRLSPYLLGKSIEWKRNLEYTGTKSHWVPTC